MRRFDLRKLLMAALFSLLNLIGGQVALILRLPIYLDTLGTLLSAWVLGPAYGVLAAVTSASIAGMTFDTYSFFFMPTGILLGLLGGLLARRGYFEGRGVLVSSLVLALAGSIVSSFIAARLFGGVTSSGSSILAQFLRARGMNLVLAVFITQFFTDLADKFISLVLVGWIRERLPARLVER